jgi:hypothetical protein
VPTSDGGFIIAGRIDNKETGRDAFIIKTDSSGREEWSIPVGGAKDDIGTSIIEGDNASYVFAGITSSKGHGSEDAWLVKLQMHGKNAAHPKNSALIMNASQRDESIIFSNSAANISEDIAFQIKQDMSSHIANEADLNISENDSFGNSSGNRSDNKANDTDYLPRRTIYDIEKIFNV